MRHSDDIKLFLIFGLYSLDGLGSKGYYISNLSSHLGGLTANVRIDSYPDPNPDKF